LKTQSMGVDILLFIGRGRWNMHYNEDSR
jgi:hypothetical protein